jgi:hypothetical protein
MSNDSAETLPQDQFSSGTTWRPDQGEHPRTITGKLVNVRSVEGSYGAYPLLELEQDDGITWVVHAFRDVLKSELANAAPQIRGQDLYQLRRPKRKGLLPVPGAPRRRQARAGQLDEVQRPGAG